jgi:osmotically-inducible protein OsmY
MQLFFNQKTKIKQWGSQRIFSTTLLFILMFIMMGLSQNLTDWDITLAVEDALNYEEGVDAILIDVETNQGVVELSGFTSNLLSKERAAKVARTIKGVRSVINEIVVRGTVRSDEVIKLDVEKALLNDPATESYEITTTVSEGVVALKGTVQSWQEKQLATEVAMGVKGVKGVNNKLIIEYPESRPDLEIKQDIEGRLRSDVWIDEWLIDVTVKNGDVHLIGSVGSAQEKRWAMADAWVMGVKSVSADGLGINWWLEEEKQRDKKFVHKSDNKIKDAVIDALIRDPYLEIHDIVVTAFNGRIFLNGEVNTLSEKEHAKDVAEGVIGVIDLVNNIEYRPVTVAKSDWELKQDIHQGLFWNPLINEDEITVFVEDGTVTLSGEVDNISQRITASDISYDAGADWVRNEINVQDVPEINQ